jgi:exodeoxyribonuclease-3
MSFSRGWALQIKITTWNINSVRLRMPLIAQFLNAHQPDILCLQETKCRDSEFPGSEIRKLGYEYCAINGQKGYHGVALVSRLPLESVERIEFCENGDARHIAASFNVAGRPIRLHNFYVPAGGDEADAVKNPKFAHKLSFLNEMHRLAVHDATAKGDTILVGDFNIAPDEHDVWSHKAMLKEVSHTEVETDKLKLILGEGGWIDTLRAFTPREEKLYTWWSYRARDWAKADRGRRLDHIWTSRSLEPNLSGIEILRDARGWERPSDHVPVSLNLNL